MNTFVMNPNAYDVVFLSYDEPNADENYEHLLKIKPKAKRIHGVKGSDAAHKAVAEIVKTDRVLIVDGDNKIKSNFFGNNVYTKPHFDWSEYVFSYSSYNPLNGNCYGNGGIKCWPVHLLKEMRTHEIGDGVDFQLDKYLELNRIGSETIITASPLQAFRAGFRDGMKLLDTGSKDFEKMDWRNRERLYNWMHIGSDIKNGLWAIYGARLGAFMLLRGHDIKMLNDFDKINEVFETYSGIANINLMEECNKIGRTFNSKYVHDVLLADESKEMKLNYEPPMRSAEEFLAGTNKENIDKFYASTV
jgi:hypothetical protein